MISVIDLEGSSYPVPAREVTTNEQLYYALLTYHGLSNVRLFSHGHELPEDDAAIPRDILIGDSLVALIRDSLEFCALVEPNSFPRSSRFTAFFVSPPALPSLSASASPDAASPDGFDSSAASDDARGGRGHEFRSAIPAADSGYGDLLFRIPSEGPWGSPPGEEASSRGTDDELDSEEEANITDLMLFFPRSREFIRDVWISTGREMESAVQYLSSLGD
jgi:hypothetical protein